MHPLKNLAGIGAALAMCVSPTMAAATSSSATPQSNPLIAVSAFGTQASAQTVCAQVVGAAGTAAAAQGQAGCVLPAVETAPPPMVSEGARPMVSGWDLGTSILLGLGSLFLLAGIISLFNDDDDDDIAISPA